MRSLLLSSLVLEGAFLFLPVARGNQQPSLHLVAADNINSRYTVESIEVAGEAQPDLPPSLRVRVAKLIGARFDPAQFDDLAREIRKELHLRSVKPQVLRGSSPDMVRVRLEIERRSVEFDLSVPKFLYHSSQGWSAQVQASTTIARNNVLRAGLVSDGDELTERFAGFNAAYERLNTGSSRVHTSILVEEFHEQWNSATVRADPTDSLLYRARRNFQPQAVFLISDRNSPAGALTATVGLSFEQLDMQAPGAATESANAILAGLAYDKRLESSGTLQQQVQAAYSLRVSPASLGSDFAYTRHRANLRYTVTFGRNTITDEALAGTISGNAPLYERFVVGTSSLLRGWNRYDIDPLGGNRLVHNSVEYSFRIDPGTLQFFYDAGMLWNQGQSAPLRHSLGFGYRQSVFSLALAFPVRDGRIEPVLMVGMNY